MSQTQSSSLLQMIYPDHLLNSLPVVQLSPDYDLRPYRPGDEAAFYRVMDQAGFIGWNSQRLAPWLARIIPNGWFMAVHQPSGQIAATAMGLHYPGDLHPFGGALGWVAADPAHAGHQLGMAVAAAVTARLMDAGYEKIHLFTEPFRMAAIKSYFKIGYVPFLNEPADRQRWQLICQQIDWRFTPDHWQALNDIYLSRTSEAVASVG